MNKIFDWTVGSIFRTLGRIVAYIIVGFLAFTVLNGFDLSDLKNNILDLRLISLPKVDALSLDGSIASNEKISDTKGYISVSSGSENSTYNFQYTPNTGNHNYAVFTMQGFSYLQNDWDFDTTLNFQVTQLIPYLNITLKTTGAWENCELQNNFIVCPLPPNKNITGLYINYDSGNSIPQDSYFELSFYIGEYVSIYDTDTQALQGAINNQTQQQQQQHQEMLNDTTTDAEDEAADFFSDFDVPDVGGLSAIITAPLNTIQGLLNNSCTSLVLPLPFVNQNLTLPCLNSIYSQYFGAFFSLYQTIMLAIISYRCIRSVFFDIKGFTDPNDGRIEVMDL